MSYSKVTFSAIVPLNLSNLNMLGCQYDEMVNDIESHNHNTRYYTKTLMDSTFVHASNDGAGSGCNAATIDGMTKAQLLSSVMNDLIVWFYSDTIPSGWHICDGTNGTINAVNKYIIGADDETIFDTGGNDSFSPSVSLTINEHVLTTDEIPSHRHSVNNRYFSAYSWSHYYIPSSSTPHNAPWESSRTAYTGYTGSNQGHSHTGSVSINSVDNRPKTKCLNLIQKISS